MQSEAWQSSCLCCEYTFREFRESLWITDAGSSKTETVALLQHPIATMSVLLALPAGKGSRLPNNSLKCVKSDWREKRKLPWVILASPGKSNKQK